MVEEKNSFDVIILGDSAGWADIRPNVLEEKLALKTYNLSVNLMQSHLMSYVLLKRYLAHCVHKPKYIIIQVSSLSLLCNLRLTQNILTEYILPYTSFSFDLLRELPPDLRFFYMKMNLLNLVPSIKNQFIFQSGDTLKRALSPNHFKKSYDMYMKSYSDEKGYFNESLGRANAGVQEVKEVPDDIQHLDMSSFNTQYVKKILQLLNEHQIDVILTLNPVRTDVFRLWSQYSLEEKLQKIMDELCREYSIFLCIRNMQDLVYSNDLFVDNYHLSAEGADFFTEFLSAQIRGQKEGPNSHSSPLQSNSKKSS
jgi:hypothetical protein